MIDPGTALRWLHLAAGAGLAGTSALLLLAGPTDRPTALRWHARALTLCRALVLLALGSGVLVLAHQAAALTGRAAAALEPDVWSRLLLDTQSGRVWLMRGSLLLLLAAFLSIREPLVDRTDWRAARGQSALLAAAALALLAATGHAVAVEPGRALAVATHAAHGLAAGVWAGALPALAVLLALAAREAGADARPYAVRAARRFSRLALTSVGVLVVTGTANAVTHVGSVAGLVGTAYGRLLLLKLALVVAVLALAATGRRRHLPALGGDAARVGRPAMARLARVVTGEAAIILVLLAVVAALTTTPPARHASPTWPFPIRLTAAVIADEPALAARVLVGSQVAVLGLVALAAGVLARPGRRLLLGAGVGGLATGLALALPPLAIDAYPTTYRRPLTPYHATSVAAGHALYREHCAACHGPDGAGDGPAAATLPVPPADLRAPHTGQHTAGDLFWWLTHGIPRSGMPAFGDRLAETERWDLVNFVRALGAAAAARDLGPTVDGPRLPAPDLSFAVGPAPGALRDYRGRRIVVLVLYTLPESLPRLAQFAASYDVLVLLGVEVIAVPTDAAPDALRRLGDTRVLYPVVTDGAAAIVATYRLFAPGAPHAEFLIDRQGYLRARWIPGASPPLAPLDPLLAEVQALNAEPVPPALPDLHVH